MYCTKCGTEMIEDAVFCVKCGCAVKQGGPSNARESAAEENTGMKTAINVLMIIGTVLMAIATCGIGLAWCLPMYLSYINKVKNEEEIGTGFKVCVILFVSMIAGILMLCENEN